MTAAIDPVALASRLIACKSITPATGEVFDVLEEALVSIGFEVHRFILGEAPDGPVENLYASRGSGGPHFGFAGHLDVVPAGEGWDGDPNHTSLRRMGELIVGQLLASDPPVRIIYKPHPMAGTRSPEVARAHENIVALIRRAGGRGGAAAVAAGVEELARHAPVLLERGVLRGIALDVDARRFADALPPT